MLDAVTVIVLFGPVVSRVRAWLAAHPVVGYEASRIGLPPMVTDRPLAVQLAPPPKTAVKLALVIRTRLFGLDPGGSASPAAHGSPLNVTATVHVAPRLVVQLVADEPALTVPGSRIPALSVVLKVTLQVIVDPFASVVVNEAGVGLVKTFAAPVPGFVHAIAELVEKPITAAITTTANAIRDLIVRMLLLKVNIVAHPPFCSARLSVAGTGAFRTSKLGAPVPVWMQDRLASITT